MNKLKAVIAPITDWLMNPKVLPGLLVLLALAFAAASVVVYLLFPFYEGLPLLLIAIAGCFLAVAVLYQTMRRAEDAQKALDQKKEAIVQKTFSDGITFLGHESESVILGGIHSLLDLAKENNDYRPRILKILCTHIKTTTVAKEYRKKYPKQPSTTIQILLDSLFKDEEYNIFTVDPVKYRVDLSGAYLAGSDLRGARLQYSNLVGAELQGARLEGAQLQSADLKEAQLQRANLWGAQLQGADLRGTQLQEAGLITARLQRAWLVGAQLQRASLEKAQLQGAYLWEAQLQGAYLREAQLQGADLMEAQLQGARLQKTEMQAAFMYRTHLPHETQMGGSNLWGVSSRNPNREVIELKELEELDFKKRIENRMVEEANLKGVKFDKVNPDLANPRNEGRAQNSLYTKEEADRWIKEYEEALPWKKHKD